MCVRRHTFPDAELLTLKLHVSDYKALFPLASEGETLTVIFNSATFLTFLVILGGETRHLHTL